VILVPRDGSQPVWLHTSPGFVFHVCNAFEDGTDRIIADGLWYERFPEVAPFEDLPRIGFGDFPRMMPTRFVLDLKNRTVKAEQISAYPGELPRIHPEYVGRPYRFFWCSATPSNWSGPYLSGVTKVDTEMRTTVFRDFAPDLTILPETKCRWKADTRHHARADLFFAGNHLRCYTALKEGKLPFPVQMRHHTSRKG
jgi:all-trans-8'-apo-beta-carotenal 15,15'-oxygenase